MATFGASATSNPNPNKSIEVTQPPGDSVSSLNFSPKANFLVATSWDSQVRCWEITRSGATLGSVPKASISHDQPVLCSSWKDDGTTVFSGGCDKQVKMWPLLSGGQPVTVAMHDAPIKEVAWIPEMNMLATGSWDKTLKYWDLRQPNPVHTQQLPDRCYAMTVRHPLMVVGTADRNLIVFNLQQPQNEYKRITSPLKYQTRCVAAFPDQQGFLLAGCYVTIWYQSLDLSWVCFQYFLLESQLWADSWESCKLLEFQVFLCSSLSLLFPSIPSFLLPLSLKFLPFLTSISFFFFVLS
ncbi:protein RAE1 isoform X2 [Hevea brasiliensis]|uniref:protein RAE1 isoform X2 n=1 Tax=Hevea brasiliensis TaxID=3981 RepID=UPI0025EB6216|nr:protein RAE1 isoform X2 [Hevea brasiliensis]